MSRKGEITSRINERDFPHLVELELPPGGLGEGDLAISAFHRERGIELRYLRREDSQVCVTLCFAEPAAADAFQRRFGGTRLERGFGRRVSAEQHFATADER
jgi:hypothetical protein